MWHWWVLSFFGASVLFLYAGFKYLMGNKDYWQKHNVYYLDMNKVNSFWTRMSFKLPLHIMDSTMYQYLKSNGVRDYAGVIEFRKPNLVVMDLDLIKAITVKDFDHFVNRRVFNMKEADPLFHDMLVNKENQEWKDLRSTLSPTFTTGKIKRMFQVFNESGDKLATFLDQESQKNVAIDFRDAITRYTLDVIASGAFGFDSRVFVDTNSPFRVMAKRVQTQFSGWKIIKFILVMVFPKLLNMLRIPLSDKEAISFFAGVIKETIRRREESGEKRDDFIQLLIEARSGDLDEDTNPSSAEGGVKGKKVALTDDIILSQALLFFVAGFDTMETALVFAIYELAVNQEVQQKLYEEIKNALDNNGGELTYETVNHMEYLDKTFSETLRKYPPAIRSERKCNLDYKLPNSDYVLKKGQVCIIPMYGIHHDAEYYPDPEKFDPERFSPEAKAARHPYAYFPFGSGPRNCIASRFAIIEGKAALAHLIHKFKIEPCAQTSIPPNFTKGALFKPDDMTLKATRR